MRWMRRRQGKWHFLDFGRTTGLCDHFLDDGSPAEMREGRAPPDGLLCARCCRLLKNRETYQRAARG